MDWQTQLITLYPFVCEHVNQGLWIHAQRFAPHSDLGFTDEGFYAQNRVIFESLLLQ
ncbi:MAG: hypothetical protein JNJ76_06430 [Candidatus Competibacter sp.]|nr:hypothetical protein [Candidatus Competibacter sp.]